jgi:hypothetical protein
MRALVARRCRRDQIGDAFPTVPFSIFAPSVQAAGRSGSGLEQRRGRQATAARTPSRTDVLPRVGRFATPATRGRSGCAPGAGAIFWLHRRRPRANKASRTTSGCRDGGVIRNDPLQRGNMIRRPACHDAMAGLLLRQQFLIWWNMDSGPTLNMSVGGAVASGADWPWSAS